MIIPATADDILSLLHSHTSSEAQHDPGDAIAPPDVLRMLAELASTIETRFAPAAWRVVEHGQTIGLCSVTRVPSQGELDIGYGIAPNHQRGGAATRAVAAIVSWCRSDGCIARITAETALANLASQRVLERNGFVQTGSRTDPEDGELLCWALQLD
jgi:RimJ/RimL family protein N-acetyltransferase